MSRVLKMIVAATLFGTGVMAQPAGAPPPVEAPAGAQPPAVDLPVRQRPTLSPQEMIGQGREYRQRMQEASNRVQAVIEQAKSGKDIIRANCLLDKLTQIRANITIAEQALQTLQEAAARNDEGASLHEYTRVTIVNQKVQVLSAEADACVGEDLSYVGATRVDVDTTGVPGEDYTQPGLPAPSDVSLRPEQASVYQ